MLLFINSRLLTCLAGGMLLAAYLIDASSAIVSTPSTNFLDATKIFPQNFFALPGYPNGGFGYSDNSWMQWGSNYEDLGYGQAGTIPWNEAGHFGFGHGSSLEDYFDDYYYPTDDGYYPFLPIPVNPEIWYPGDPYGNFYEPKPIGRGMVPRLLDPRRRRRPHIIHPHFPLLPSRPSPRPGNGKIPHRGVLNAGNKKNPHGVVLNTGNKKIPHVVVLNTGNGKIPHRGVLNAGNKKIPHGGVLNTGSGKIPPRGVLNTGNGKIPHGVVSNAGNENIPHGVVLDAGNGNVVIHGDNVQVVGGSRNGNMQFSNVPVIPVIRTHRPKERHNKRREH